MSSSTKRGTAPTRRRFLARAGGAAAAAAAGLASAPLDPLSVTVAAEEIGPDNASQRAIAAYKIRHDAAIAQKNAPMPSHPTNRDDDGLADFVGSFSKTLPHDAFGRVQPNAYAMLRNALTTGDPADFDLIPVTGPTKLVNPQAAFAFQMAGADSHHLGIRIPPAFASAEEAGEMAEVYWQALTRDVPFAHYDVHPEIAAAASSLSSFSDFHGPESGGVVTAATLFRGTAPGCLTGPYISQFLLQPVPYGPYPLEQKLFAGQAGIDYLTDYTTWLAIQNGAAPAPFVQDATLRYIYNNRALAAYLRADFTYHAFLNAALILLATPDSLDAENPYGTSPTQIGFATLGGPDILDLVAHVGNLALKAAWYQKWLVHRRLRPEAFAGAVHVAKTMGVPFPIHADLLSSSVLNAVFSRHGTYLLPVAYPEGSPAHPSYPSGHATFAGACATVLKAVFNEALPIPAPVVASADGLSLIPYAGALTVGNELNKLAANLAIGRDAAGIHWRSDGIEGMNLGEACAIALLRDLRSCYNEQFPGVTLTKFDGTTITV